MADPKKKLSEETRCLGIDFNITVAEDALDHTVFSAIVGSEFDLKQTAMAGPLKLGGRGKDDFRITGTIEFHPTESNPHFHLTVRANALEHPISAKPDWPTVRQFFGMLGAGLREPEDLSGRITGQHVYPRDWWGGMELPQPLPFGTQANRSDAELTGLEVSYGGETGPERVLLSLAAGDRFMVVTHFPMSGPVRDDFFHQAVRRSAGIGERLFNQVAQRKE